MSNTEAREMGRRDAKVWRTNLASGLWNPTTAAAYFACAKKVMRRRGVLAAYLAGREG